MQTEWIMTVLGPDRAGIVEDLASRIADAGGNWMESRLAHLGGQFAGLVQFTLPETGLEAFRDSLDELELNCVLHGALEDSVRHPACRSLEIVGLDRPGIVRAVSDALADAGGNVERFESSCESAPMSGEMLFRARVKVCFPAGTELAAIEERLGHIGDEMMLDVAWDE